MIGLEPIWILWITYQVAFLAKRGTRRYCVSFEFDLIFLWDSDSLLKVFLRVDPLILDLEDGNSMKIFDNCI